MSSAPHSSTYTSDSGDFIVDDGHHGYNDIGEEEVGVDRGASPDKSTAVPSRRLESLLAAAKQKPTVKRPRTTATGTATTDDILASLIDETAATATPAPHAGAPLPGRVRPSPFARTPVYRSAPPTTRTPVPTPPTRGYLGANANPSVQTTPCMPPASTPGAPHTPKKRRATRSVLPATPERATPAPVTPHHEGGSPLLRLSKRDQIPMHVGTSPIKKRFNLDPTTPHAYDGRNQPDHDGDQVMMVGEVDDVELRRIEETEVKTGAEDDAIPHPPTAHRRAVGAVVEEEAVEGVAASDWKDVWGGSTTTPSSTMEWMDDGTLATNADGQLPFFFLDAYEEMNQPGTAFLFGKVPVDTNVLGNTRTSADSNAFVSCCVVLKDLQRSVLFVPKISAIDEETRDNLATLDAAANDDPATRPAFWAAAHKAFASLKTEAKKVLESHGIKQFSMAPVKRNYAFENPDVPLGEQWVLKVRYAAVQGQLPLGLRGRTFSTVFGSNQTMLEALQLKRGVKGSQWLAIAKPMRVEESRKQSYCMLEVSVESAKSVAGGARMLTALGWQNPAADPPLRVVALNLKTHVNPKSHLHEIVGASVMSMPSVQLGGNSAGWKESRKEGFAVCTKLEGMPLPPRLQETAAQEQLPLAVHPNEYALLSFLLAKLQNTEFDIIVGHYVVGFDLDILLHRLDKLKVPRWDRIGRLKRARMPNLGNGGGGFGGGAPPGMMQALAGRLVCDTYLAAREYHGREVDYTLKTLAGSLLKESKDELNLSNMHQYWNSVDGLLRVLKSSVADCRLSLGVMFALNVLPLTLQISTLTGYMWSKVLVGNRSARIESLLLHEFHGRKFLLPDKLTKREKAVLEAGRKSKKAAKKAAERIDKEQGTDAVVGVIENIDEEEDEDTPMVGATASKRNRRKPAFQGGYVLEPKKGLYDKYILLLDFNSLYPSIIQEYNICFTTVERPKDGEMAQLPATSGGEMAPLPATIKNLVDRRRAVKALLKSECDPVLRHQHDVKQMALKITANSMYGCLGFEGARFYAKPLAELVTSRGREILASTVALVDQLEGLEVVYGDTDSIMVYTGSVDLDEVRKAGIRIKKEVNARYRLLELDLDGFYRRMLLLKKKKYAAVVVEEGPHGLTEKMEMKGLDIVRRDWCPLAKECGERVLEIILSGRSREDSVEAIHELLRVTRQQIDEGKVALSKFIITKQLTKAPAEYEDAKNQPHVQVALRRISQGKRGGTSAGETVPYVIAIPLETDPDAPPLSKSVGDRARHPEELRLARESLGLDVDYYVGQQIHPIVTRLCEHIDGTSSGQLAHALGLDPTRYRRTITSSSTMGEFDDMISAKASFLDADSVTPLRLPAGAGLPPVVFPGAEELDKSGRSVRDWLRDLPFDVSSVDATDVPRASSKINTDGTSPNTYAGKMAAATATGSGVEITPGRLVNEVRRHARQQLRQFYASTMRSDGDELSVHTTRDISLRCDVEAEVGTLARLKTTRGRMRPVMTSRHLFAELRGMSKLFELPKEKAHPEPGWLKEAHAIATEAKRRTGYHTVHLREWFGAFVAPAVANRVEGA